MKELSFEQMEMVNGGSAYCDLLEYWVRGGSGYQGSYELLVDTYVFNCMEMND
ncbi:MAG: hypothetical protein WAO52_14025 [Prolixibacteraceae bacterium]